MVHHSYYLLAFKKKKCTGVSLPMNNVTSSFQHSQEFCEYNKPSLTFHAQKFIPDALQSHAKNAAHLYFYTITFEEPGDKDKANIETIFRVERKDRRQTLAHLHRRIQHSTMRSAIHIHENILAKNVFLIFYFSKMNH